MSARGGGGRGRARGRPRPQQQEQQQPRQPGAPRGYPGANGQGDPRPGGGAWGQQAEGPPQGPRTQGYPAPAPSGPPPPTWGADDPPPARAPGAAQRPPPGMGAPQGQGARPKEVVYQRDPQAEVTQEMGTLSLDGGEGDRGQSSVRARKRGVNERYTRSNLGGGEGTMQISTAQHGVQGRPLPLTANYIKLVATANWIMYQYACHFSPELERSDWRRNVVVEQFLKSQGLEKNSLFDGFVVFILQDIGEKVEYAARHPNEALPNETVKITLTRAVRESECRPNSNIGLHMTNIIFKRALRDMNLTPIGRAYFDLDKKMNVPNHSMTVYPGYQASISRVEGGHIMLNLDVAHRIIRDDTAWDVCSDIYRQAQNNEDYERKVSRALLGATVMTRYNDKTYRIDDIDFKSNPRDATFHNKKKGEDCTYVQYYREAYEKDIVEAEYQPMLISRPKKKDVRGGRDQDIYLVPSLCTMTGLSQSMADDMRVKRAIQDVMRLDANQRLDRYAQFARRLEQTPIAQEKFREWGLKFEKTPVQLQGRRIDPIVLKMPKNKQGQSSQLSYDPDKADWSASMRGMALISSVDLDNWTVICTRRDSRETQTFMGELDKVARPMGFTFNGRPRYVEIENNRDTTYQNAIRDNVDSTTKLVLVVIGGNKATYDMVKKYCCLNIAVVSQCMKAGTLRKTGLMSIATKVMLQMQCKLGGELWSSGLTEAFKNPFMVMGLDVEHDTEKKTHSVMGMVSTYNRRCTKYFSQSILHPSKVELGQKLYAPIVEALKQFASKCGGRFPETLIVYRDGVGDGQLDLVLKVEVEQFKAAFAKLEIEVKLLFVVVQKRINTRFFARRGQGFTNPPPGSVIDRDVVRPEWYDFFLVSQSVRQGTVSPTHYNVLYDSVGWKADQVQKFTYMLTHMYYNWQGTIRVPAPCQYAHKLAFVVGQSLHEEPRVELSDKLWFL